MYGSIKMSWRLLQFDDSDRHGRWRIEKAEEHAR
jgi:hypothetical protein